MKHYSIVMAGSFVNQKLSALPDPFLPQRDQGRLVWLTDGTFWFGSDYRWVGVSIPDTSKSEDLYSDLLRTTIFLNASYDAFIDESLVSANNMLYRKSEAWYEFVAGNFIESVNLFDDTLDIDDVQYAIVYVEYEDTGTPTIRFSSNGGVTWSVIDNIRLFRIDHTIAGKDIRLRYTAGGSGKIISWGVLYNKDLNAACTKYGLTYKRFSAHQDQIFFEVVYVPESLQVFVNGDMLDKTDYDATTGTDVTLANPLDDGDIVYFLSFSTSLLNSIDFVRHDGSVSFSQDQSMGGNRLTMVANGVVNGDAVNVSQLNLKANIHSPAFTGIPTAPTASILDNSAQLATTKFVKDQGYVTWSGVTSVTATAPIISTGGETPNISISLVTTSAAGSMSAPDKVKLNGIETNANLYIHPTQIAIDANAIDNGINVIDRIQVNTLGHVTNVLTRDLSAVTTTTSGVMSAADKVKLNGIEAGSTGDMTANEILTAIKTVDGVGSELDADLLDGHTSTYFQVALGYTAENLANKNQINGYVGLDASGKIDANQLPSIAVTNTFVVASQIEMLALTAQTGDLAVRADLNRTYILRGANSTVLGDWQELLTPTDTVLSVASRVGHVTLVKADVGLSNVDNTSDINKPVSTATQTALNLKADLVSPVFTGTPTSTTPPPADDSTRVATTAYVKSLGFSTSAGVTTVNTNNGITGGPITVTGTVGLTGNALSLHNLSTTGIVVRSTIDTLITRSIAQGTGISVSNGDGVSANPTIANTDRGSSQAIFKTVSVSGQPTITATDNIDALTFVAGKNVSITTEAISRHITINSRYVTWNVVSTNVPVLVNNGYFVSTAAGIITVTLPASAVVGDLIIISDYAGTFDTNRCIIARNGHNICGLAQNLACATENYTVTLCYVNVTQGWRIVHVTGFAHVNTALGYQAVATAGYS